jgi:iron complex outermembrane receptor protein
MKLSPLIYLALSLAFAPPLMSPARAANEPALVLPDISVVGENEKPLLDRASTTSELSGSRLARQKRSTLGETLANQSGVNSSQFGPNASRPVVRGLGGERIRILQNGTGILDASAASQDHAVATDPLVVERIEVVQGPAALLYGSSTVGGVVNVLLKRIPESPLESFRGTFESRYTSNDQGRSIGLLLEGPVGGPLDGQRNAISKKWLYHLDGSARAADDYHAPQGAIANSFNRTWNGALGTSFVGSESFAGVSFGSYGSQYGTVVEKDVFIDMQQQRFDFSGGIKNVGGFESAKLKSTLSNYQHQEIANGQVGTTFKNRGYENRIDLKHEKIGPLEGIIGVQQNFFSFEALGDEAFLPRTDNMSTALFIFEEADFGRVKPSVAARLEKTSVASAVTAEKVANFGESQTKNFTARAASLGLRYLLTDIWTAVLNGSYTERAPNYQELFANGKHVATGIFEVANRGLDLEASKSLELALRAKTEQSSATATLFAQDFQNFIALVPTGTNDAGSGLPISAYQAVPARIYGGEIEYRYKLPDLVPGGVLEIETSVDFVRGLNLKSGTSLPRQPALREKLSVIYKTDDYQLDAEVQRSEKQTDIAPNERETAAYTLFNLGAEVPDQFGGFEFSVLTRALNLFDVEARNHVSVLKEIAPLPGRSFNLGFQASF